MVEVGPTTITQDRLKAGGRTFTLAAALGVVGLVLTAIGYGMGGAERPLILAGYLVAFAYWVGIAIAASIWNAIFHAAAARWMTVFRRVFESMGAAIPIFVLLFVPIVLGMPVLFPWVSPSNKMSHEELELLTHKALWLNIAELRLAEVRRRKRRKRLYAAAIVAGVIVAAVTAILLVMKMR